MIKLSIQIRIHLFGLNRKQKHVGKPKQEPMADVCFIQQAATAIRHMEPVRARSTVNNYRTALRMLSAYAGDGLTVAQVDSLLLAGFQQSLLEKGVSLNTISCYMRSLRSIIHFIYPDMDVQSLFKKVYTGKMRTDKRSVTVDEINRLRQLDLPKGSRLAFSRDLFLFSFYALGMPFVDIAYLRKSQIVSGYITYYRHKTRQRIRVKVEPAMQQIIDRYSTPDGPYVFPFLSEDSGHDTAVAYERARSRYNRHLRQLGRLSDMSRTLTSYVARHSWASMAYHSNVDLPVISKALGHSSPNTTLTYIREIDDQRIDVANQQLLQQVLPASSPLGR